MSTKPEDESSGTDTTSRFTELPPEVTAGAVSSAEKQGTLRRRTRAGRAPFRDELARRREKKLQEQPPVVVTESTTPEDLGMPRLIDFPAEGIPEVVDDEQGLAEVAAALRRGAGPIAVDAERASGYRYGQRAYLVQLRREGAGSFLIDPVACPDLTPLNPTLADAEWVLHAATQDLPCLAELGLHPTRLFDTELGARLAGQPRVGLAAVLEHYLGVTLAKEHSAVDWSTRPLPEPWLRYAVLDVEVLVTLRDAVEKDLHDQGKSEWARQEFHALTSFAGPARRVDPWRRLSGLHKIRDRRTMAVARELWFARDDVARSRDISPSRVIPDAALLDIAHALPQSLSEVGAATTNRAARRHASAWLAAVAAGRDAPEDQLPPLVLPSDAPPPQRAWTDRAPDAAARLAAVRERLHAFGAEHSVPVENVLTPDTLRRVLWSPPEATEEAVGAVLADRGARPWQIEIVAPMIVESLHAH
ncbi:HRDC domain-containing protein [Austwickia chelonae]|nr:HRDC domain-containing protein [Austwickia chelonae]